jgi:DNA-binding transcriptional regulator YiaG
LRLAGVRAALANGEAKRLREAAQLSIGEVARACGVDQSTVWRWEQGKRLPRGRHAMQYADVLDSLKSQTETAAEDRQTA